MTPADGGGNSPTLQEYGRVLRRRLPVIAVVVGLCAALAVAYGSRAAPSYEASSTVLVSRTAPAAMLTGVSTGGDRGDPERFVQTQAEIGRTETLAARVLRAERLPGRSPKDLLGSTEVVVGGAADVLEFRVRDRSASVAARLASRYATQFVRYQRELDRAAVQRALDEIRTRLDELARVSGGAAPSESRVYRELLSREQELQTLGPLDTGKAVVLTASSTATKVSPRPRRDLVVALALGLLIGVLVAFAVEALDRRLDSPNEIMRALGVPLLACVPRDRRRSAAMDPRRIIRADGLPSDAYRVLRRNVEAALASTGADSWNSTLVFTGATRRDDKTATLSRLAVSLAVAGRRVIIVGLDPRSAVHRIFDVSPSPGVADVARGSVAPLDALAIVGTAGEYLAVIPPGEPTSGFEAFVAGEGLPAMLDELRPRTDVVLVDAPPLLTRTDALDIARHADALVVVVRVDGVRERVVRRVASLLASSGRAVLGFIGTGADADAWTAPPGHLMPLGAKANRTDAVSASARPERTSRDDREVSSA